MFILKRECEAIVSTYKYFFVKKKEILFYRKKRDTFELRDELNKLELGHTIRNYKCSFLKNLKLNILIATTRQPVTDPGFSQWLITLIQMLNTTNDQYSNRKFIKYPKAINIHSFSKKT